MSEEFTSAVYDKLVNDTGVTDRLTTYTDDAGNSNPAVFTGRQVPGDAETPYIHTHGQVTDEPFGSKNSDGRDFTRDILIADEDDGSAKDVEEISELVRDLFHESTLSMSSFEEPIVLQASGPIAVVDEEKNLDVRVVTLSVIAMETA